MKSAYRGHRFPPEIISRAIWLYHRFTLSFRDVEDLLAERGITVSSEAIDPGASSLDRSMLGLCAGNRVGLGTSGMSMKCSLRFKEYATACGGQWIKMEMASILWSPSTETVEPPSASFAWH
jgi:hypothetical protein